jgi:hypothetical protein
MSKELLAFKNALIVRNIIARVLVADGGEGLSAMVSKAETRSKKTSQFRDQMKGLKSRVDNGDPTAKRKFERAYDELFANGEAAEKDADKLLKVYIADNDSEGQAGDAIEMLDRAVRDWKSNKIHHAQTNGEFVLSRDKLLQAEHTWAYATKIDDQIKMLHDALMGDYNQ